MSNETEPSGSTVIHAFLIISMYCALPSGVDLSESTQRLMSLKYFASVDEAKSNILPVLILPCFVGNDESYLTMMSALFCAIAAIAMMHARIEVLSLFIF